MKTREIVEVSKKGQLLIPKLYRIRTGMKSGSKVSLSLDGDRLILRVLPADPLEAACGLLKGGPSLGEALLQERREEREKEKKNLRR
jgi:AbrB family looped-hinge helix DNA binding protein